MKRIIELSIKGVGLALALFAVFGLVADVANQGVFTLKNYNYTKDFRSPWLHYAGAKG